GRRRARGRDHESHRSHGDRLERQRQSAQHSDEAHRALQARRRGRLAVPADGGRSGDLRAAVHDVAAAHAARRRKTAALRLSRGQLRAPAIARRRARRGPRARGGPQEGDHSRAAAGARRTRRRWSAGCAGSVLVALDWGTSNLRAYLMSAEGDVVETRRAARGILHLQEPGGAAGFEQAFADVAGDWVRSHSTLSVVAGGMVGSAQGWIEAPYVRAPADVRTLAARAARVPSGLGPDVLIAPGVIFEPPDRPPDVMRGEEIKIAGAVAAEPSLGERAWFVLPGTHSKWAFVQDERILSFATYMTGELYAVLREHSIL